MCDQQLGEGGINALRAERRTSRDLRKQLFNLRAAVIDATNNLVDVVEQDGGVRRNGR